MTHSIRSDWLYATIYVHKERNQSQNQNQYRTEVLFNELSILNSMIQDSEV